MSFGTSRTRTGVVRLFCIIVVVIIYYFFMSIALFAHGIQQFIGDSFGRLINRFDGRRLEGFISMK